MSARKICTCDNCGKEEQTKESFDVAPPKPWDLICLFGEARGYHVCSTRCAIQFAVKNLEALQKREREEIEKLSEDDS